MYQKPNILKESMKLYLEFSEGCRGGGGVGGHNKKSSIGVV